MTKRRPSLVLVLASLLCLVTAACASGPPEPNLPCDRASSGPRVAPPYDGSDALAGMRPADLEQCGVAVTASTLEETLQRQCADHPTCGQTCIATSRVRRATLRAAEIAKALLELRARVDALPPSTPCLRALEDVDTGALSAEGAASLLACTGTKVELPGFVVFAKDGKLQEVYQQVQLMPHGEQITFHAAMFPVDCSPPEWAVDRTPP
jgi:hypothetical protein